MGADAPILHGYDDLLEDAPDYAARSVAANPRAAPEEGCVLRVIGDSTGETASRADG